MRRLLIVLAILVVCSAPTWADNVEYDVNAWATFTATQPCSFNCTETIGLNFLYMPPSDFLPNPGSDASSTGQIVLGSMNESSSGFLGSLSYPTGPNISIQGYIPFANSMHDEVDLRAPVLFPGDTSPVDGILPGINTTSFDLFYCYSQTCNNAMGPDADLHPSPSSQFVVVTPVQVPDGDSPLVLSFGALGTFALAWRWRRREV